MNFSPTSNEWVIAQDVQEVHTLLQLSDEASARPGAPAPLRNMSSSRRHVESRNVHLLRQAGRAVGMFTLTDEPPFDCHIAGFSPAERPIYMQRLAVRPGCADPLLGLKLLRRAIKVAAITGADVLRAEANPRLVEVGEMMKKAGFITIFEAETPIAVRYIEMPISI